MKNSKRTSRLFTLCFLLFATSLFLSNCENSDIEHNTEHQLPNLKKVDLSKNSSISNFVKDQTKGNYQNRTITSPIGEINLEDALQYVDSLNNTSYSILLERHDSIRMYDFENLIIIDDENIDTDDYKIFILRYESDYEWIKQNNYQFKLNSFTGTLKHFDVNYELIVQNSYLNGELVNGIQNRGGVQSRSSGACTGNEPGFWRTVSACNGIPWDCNGDPDFCGTTEEWVSCGGGAGSPTSPTSGTPTDTSPGDGNTGGSNTGGTQTPYTPNPDNTLVPNPPVRPNTLTTEEIAVFELTARLGLNSQQESWLNNNLDQAVELYNFGDENDWSTDAENWANGQIELHTLKSQFSENPTTNQITLNYNPGLINGRADQAYTHIGTDGARVAYKMEDNSFVLSSPDQLILNSNSNLPTAFTTEVNNDHYWYILPEGSTEWSNYLIKESSQLADELETLFILGGQNLALFLGTYVVPLEDIKIVFTGTDFNGDPTSRWLAAGLLVVEIVPGGKLLKAIKFIPTSAISGTIKYAKTVIKANGKVTTLYFDVINGIVNFGNRSKLAEVIGTVGVANTHAHHIIPWARGNHSLIQKAAKSENAFHLNEALNGIPRPSSLHLTGHSHYNTVVENLLDDFNHINDPDEAYDFISGLANHIRELINANPGLDSGQVADLISYP